MCAIDDCEPWQACHYGDRKARTPHTCCECARVIQAGEEYHFLTGLSGEPGAKWQDFHICRHCRAAGAWLMLMCGGHPLEMLVEELREHLSEYSQSKVLAELLKSVQAGWAGGQDPIPDTAVLRTDANNCLRELTA